MIMEYIKSLLKYKFHFKQIFVVSCVKEESILRFGVKKQISQISWKSVYNKILQ